MAVSATPACKPQTLQTSVCTLTVAKRRARAPPYWNIARKDPFRLAQPMGSRNVRAPLFESAATMVNDRHHHHDRHRSRVTMVMVVTVLACCFTRSPQRVPRSHAVWFLHPRRDVTLPMQHTPDIDVV